MEKPHIIAEACCNHMGDYNIAIKMIDAAKENGADYVKFQKKDVKTWVNRKPEIYNKPHPNPENAFGSTYAEHRKFLEFDIETHKKLKHHCEEVGIKYACSVFDLTSAKEIISLKPDMVKIASACNNNFELLEYVIQNYDGEIHISLGMTEKKDIENIVELFVKNNRNKDLVLYACTSSYPLNPSSVCLLEIKYLKEKYGKIVKKIGYSGHHIGINIDIAAYALGAECIERHFTLDRSIKGTDQKYSILPNEMKELHDNLNEIYKALTYKDKGILDVELGSKEKLKW